MGEQNERRRTVTGIALRWSHLAVIIVVWVLTVGTIYGSMRTELTAAREELKELKEQSIPRGEFKEFRDDLERRLNRLEWKVGEQAISK